MLFLSLTFFARAIVPPGFMPSPIHGISSFNSLFMLCHSDWQSSQLLDTLHDSHHSMAHDASGHSEGHDSHQCDFDALLMALAGPSDGPIMAFNDASATAESAFLKAAILWPAYRSNLARAPPPDFVSFSYSS